MKEDITVKELFNRLLEAIENGQGHYEMDIRRSDGKPIKNSQLVARIPEKDGLHCLFG